MAATLRLQKHRSTNLSEHSSSRQPTKQTIEIPALRLLKPHQQGELDFLCGLYAAINAIRLLREEFAPLARVECKQLCATGCEYLADKSGGLHLALTWGLSLRRRYDLTKHLAQIASTDTHTIGVERAGLPPNATIKDVFAWIDDSLISGKPVLIFFENLPDHYTVAASSSPKLLGLFDSAGTRAVRKASCGIRCGRWHIAPNGLLRMTAEHLP